MKKKNSGTGTDENYVTKWEFFTALNFMFKNSVSAGPVLDSMVSIFY